MTDVDDLETWFPGIERALLEDIAAADPVVNEWDVAAVLNELAGGDDVAPGDYSAILDRQRVDGWASVACDECGKTFTGETREAAQRKVNGHKSSHRVQSPSGDDPAADDDEGGSETVRDVEKRLEDETDREAGDYPNAFEAVPELEDAADAEDLEADGGTE